MAAAEVVLQVRPQPPPPPPPPRAAAMVGLPVPDLSEVKPFMYLYLSTLWVGSAALAGAVVARRACGEDSPVRYAFFMLSIGALLCTGLLLLVISLITWRTMRARGIRLSLSVSVMQARKILGALSWEVLRDTAVLGFLGFFSFLLLNAVGALVHLGLLPVKESQRERIGYALFDVGLLGALSMCCFIIIPNLTLKLWRSK